MIKELFTTVIAVATINNTTVNNTKRINSNMTTINNTTRASADINNYPNLLQQTTTDSDENLLTGTYYQVKEFTNDLEMQYGTIEGKGFQYLTVDTTLQRYAWTTEYYFKISYDDGEETNFSYENMTINLRGYINPNIQLDAYYEDYYLFSSYNNQILIDTFIYTDTYTFQQLNTLRTNISWDTVDSQNVTTVGTNCELTLPNKYKYVRWLIEWKIDEIWDENNDINTSYIPQMLSDLNNVYSSATTTYTYSFEVEMKMEVIDIPDLIFTILGMPFAWISTAFNLTLFSGTPYAINVSRLFFEIICTLILIIVLKKVLK